MNQSQDNTREAYSVFGMPRGPSGEDAMYYCVGAPHMRLVNGRYEKAGIVTRITVTVDLPGMYASMERVRVFDGETMIFEAPLHNVEGVEYPASAKLAEA